MSGFGSYGLKKNRSSESSGSTALTAVALQDHILRNLSLSSDVLRPSQQRKIGKPKPRKEIKATVDTGRGRTSPKKKAAPEREYVLDPKPPKPTLAQKMGLVEAPPQLLSEEDWSSVKAKSNKRQDFSHPCVICKEHIGSLEQVLLSCSHVFHKACLQAFEKFSGRKTCPMCRKEQYQTRVVHDGSRQYKIRCATVIQAAWRGYVVHCWYKKLRETVPPKDPKLRRKFYEDKLTSITDRMIKSCDYNINDFLGEIDRNLQASRDIFKHFDNAAKIISDDDWFDIQLKAVQRGNQECPICLNSLSHQPNEDDAPTDNDVSSKAQEKLVKLEKNGSKLGAAHYLKNKKIPSKTNRTKTVPTATKNKSPQEKFCEKVEKTFEVPNINVCGEEVAPKQTVLLSCSHVFHQNCLDAFEEFTVGERRFVCPVCRATYQKKIIDL